MSYGSLNKGSVWRKWDLHVHTSASAGFKGTCEQVAEQIKQSDCAVVGVNDYASIEGYAKLKELDCGNATLLPVVEFRMNNYLMNKKGKPAQKVNFHIIFDDKIPVTKLRNIVGSIDYYTDSGSTGLLGNDTNPDFLKTVGVDYHFLLNKLNDSDTVKNKFLIWVPYDEYGGIDEMKPEDLLKSHYIRTAHFLGSSSKKQIKFFLWQDDRFSIDEYRKFLGSKKGCIKGSDSHDWQYPIGKLKNANSIPIQKYCWIKANPSFEGLKQAAYDPESRISIQEEHPEQKLPYFVIDKVCFKNSDFPSEWIELNQNMVTIIGGKSTGKSLFLYFMAKSINSQEVSDRFQEGSIYSALEKNDFDFQVHWKDGYISTLQGIKDDDEIENGERSRKVLYIPQHYLNKLSEKDAYNRKSLDEIVLNAYKQNEKVKSECESFFSQVYNSEDLIKQLISRLFREADKKEKAKTRIAELGNRDGVLSFVKALEEDISLLQRKSNLSPSERQMLSSGLGRISGIHEELRQLESDRKSASREYQALSSELNSCDPNNSSRLFGNSKVTSEAEKAFAEIRIMFGKVHSTFSRINNVIDDETKAKKLEFQKVKDEISPVQKKASFSSELNEKIKLKDKEQAKLSEIEQMMKIAKLHHKNTLAICADVMSRYKGLLSLHINFAKSMKEKAPLSDLMVDARIEFDSHRFNENFIKQFLDKRSNLYKEVTTDGEFEYNYDNHLDKIKKIFKGIVSGTLKLRSNKTLPAASERLLDNHFYITFDINYRGDKFESMSPGKKGLVILKFIIELNLEKWPILLDQPEDDLDNRSIYNELVSFLREKKPERQIIIVTHNANLVVGADSEQVVVANQRGQEMSRNNRQNRFEYVSGALEHSFQDIKADGILFQKGIREHVCEILEGGVEAFQKRERKYDLSNKNFDFSKIKD